MYVHSRNPHAVQNNNIQKPRRTGVHVGYNESTKEICVIVDKKEQFVPYMNQWKHYQTISARDFTNNKWVHLTAKDGYKVRWQIRK